MWFLKGVALGFVLFSIFTVMYIRAASPSGPHSSSGVTAMGASFLASLIVFNPLYWTVTILIFGTSTLICWMMNFKPGPV